MINRPLAQDSQRLWDLVRYMRSELHVAELITDNEYAALAQDHAAVARLEARDAQRQRKIDDLGGYPERCVHGRDIKFSCRSCYPRSI
jgi:hypothetical protein